MVERHQAAINDALADLLRCTTKARREVLTELRIQALCLCDPRRLEEQEAFAAAAELLAAIESAAAGIPAEPDESGDPRTQQTQTTEGERT